MPADPSPLIDFLTACWFGVIGACVGSFLNVVAYRMPLGMSVVWKPSHCPKCQTPILARDNVPVLGWLWLRGKCRACGAAISPRYAIVEAAMGLTFFVLAYAEVFSGGANLPEGPIAETTGALANVIEPNWTLLGVYAFHCALLSLLMCVVLVDQDKVRFPWSWATIPLAVAATGPYWKMLRYAHRDGLSTESGVATVLVLCLLGLAFSRSKSCMRMRKNLVFAYISVLTFLGFDSAPTVVVITLLFYLLLSFLPLLRRLLSSRVWIASIFLATLIQIVFWKQLHETIAR